MENKLYVAKDKSGKIYLYRDGAYVLDSEKLYVARDKDDALYVYLGYPTKSSFEYRHGTSGNQACIGSLPNKLFPEVTFDGGPVELILSGEGFTSSRANLPESKMNLLL